MVLEPLKDLETIRIVFQNLEMIRIFPESWKNHETTSFTKFQLLIYWLWFSNYLHFFQARRNQTIAHPSSGLSHNALDFNFGLEGLASGSGTPLGGGSSSRHTPGGSGRLNSKSNSNPFLFPDPTSSPLPGLDPTSLSSSSLTYPLQHMGARRQCHRSVLNS